MIKAGHCFTLNVKLFRLIDCTLGYHPENRQYLRTVNFGTVANDDVSEY